MAHKCPQSNTVAHLSKYLMDGLFSEHPEKWMIILQV